MFAQIKWLSLYNENLQFWLQQKYNLMGLDLFHCSTHILHYPFYLLSIVLVIFMLWPIVIFLFPKSPKICLPGGIVAMTAHSSGAVSQDLYLCCGTSLTTLYLHPAPLHLYTSGLQWSGLLSQSASGCDRHSSTALHSATSVAWHSEFMVSK